MGNVFENIQLSPRKFVAPEYIYGVDSRLMAGVFCKKLGGRKVLFVTDEGLMHTTWFKEVSEELQKHSVEYVVYSTISPNPRDFEVMNGKLVYEENKCNMILSLGGGSVIDCAKGIGIVSSNTGDIRDFEGVDMINVPIPPLICIPTTGGTAADVSQFAIINNTTEKYKFAIISKAVVPDVALIDPFILTSMDPFLTACTGMDALSHSFEAFVSNANSPFTDLYALESIRLIKANLQDCLTNPSDMQARGKIMLASLYAGLAFSNASLGCVHSLAHSLGGYLDLPHGECNAILLPHVVDFNFNSSVDRYKQIADVFDVSAKGKPNNEIKNTLIDHLLTFKQSLGIKTTLHDKGVSIDVIPQIASKAINDPCNATNPKPPVKNDLEAICKEAL